MVRKRMQEKIGDKLIYLNEPFSMNSEAIYYVSAYIECMLQGIVNAFVEMWLLGETDEIIISPLSTFGSAAHAR
jgi:hypothetical protein